MDAIRLLRKDHRDVKDLLAELQGSEGEDPSARADLLADVAFALESHARLEEELFYPALRALGDPEDEKLTLTSLEEHRLVRSLLSEMEKTEPGSALFTARARVLRALVLHHIRDEEKRVFGRVKSSVPESELERLGGQLAVRKHELTRIAPDVDTRRDHELDARE